MQPRVVMHPNPKPVGRDASDERDANGGKRLYVELANEIRGASEIGGLGASARIGAIAVE